MAKKTIFKYSGKTRPSWVQIKEREDRTDVLYGNRGASNHGHTVQKDGKLKYARTPEGRVIHDEKAGLSVFVI